MPAVPATILMSALVHYLPFSMKVSPSQFVEVENVKMLKTFSLIINYCLVTRLDPHYSILHLIHMVI